MAEFGRILIVLEHPDLDILVKIKFDKFQLLFQKPADESIRIGVKEQSQPA